MNTITADPKSFKTFAQFYPFYLGEHCNRTCRRLHFAGYQVLTWSGETTLTSTTSPSPSRSPLR